MIMNQLGKVLGSASKIVLLMFAGSTCAALFTGHIDSAIFSAAGMLVLGFYFGSTKVNGSTDSQ